MDKKGLQEKQRGGERKKGTKEVNVKEKQKRKVTVEVIRVGKRMNGEDRMTEDRNNLGKGGRKGRRYIRSLREKMKEKNWIEAYKWKEKKKRIKSS